MPSSISSSKPRWHFRSAKALLLLVLACALVEAASRTVLLSASKDLRRFRDYPQRAATLVANPKPQIAFVGNSATDDGVDLDVFRRNFEALAGPVVADKFVADASRINTWHHLLKHTFFDQNLKASTHVITFYEDDLLDGNQVEVGRLAYFFTGVADWPSVFAVDLQDFEARVDFVLSSFSAAIAVRTRVKERMLSALVPNYKAFSVTVNDVNLAMHSATSYGAAASFSAPNGGGLPEIQGTRALERLLLVAQAQQAKLVFVAYPLPTAFAHAPYSIDARVPGLLAAAGASFIDARLPAMWGLRPQHYKDDVHLNREGSQLWSTALAKLLAAAPPR